MALELSTAGMLVSYAIGTPGSHPTSGYTIIPGVKSIPSLGDEVPTLESTTLAATKNKTYVPGLRDSGGAIQLTVNDYAAFRTAWSTMMSALTSARSTAPTSIVWVQYSYPAGSGLDSMFYPAEPSELGFGGADVDEVLENAANFIPQGDYAFGTAVTPT